MPVFSLAYIKASSSTICLAINYSIIASRPFPTTLGRWVTLTTVFCTFYLLAHVFSLNLILSLFFHSCIHWLICSTIFDEGTV